MMTSSENTFEPLAKLFVSVILNEVNDLNHLKIRDYMRSFAPLRMTKWLFAEFLTWY